LYASTGYIRGSSALASLGFELEEGNFDSEAIKKLQVKWEQLQLEEREFARQVKLKASDADIVMFSGYVSMWAISLTWNGSTIIT
jgi:fructoselysine-6-P-deglycase FrlB-like protein